MTPVTSSQAPSVASVATLVQGNGFMPGQVSLRVGYSTALFAVFWVAQCAVLCAIGLWPVAWPGRLGLLLAMAVASLYHLWRAWGDGGAVVALDYAGNGWARLTLRNGRRLRARRCPRALVSPGLVILHFMEEPSGTRYCCLIPRRANWLREHRQLRVLLRHPL